MPKTKMTFDLNSPDIEADIDYGNQELEITVPCRTIPRETSEKLDSFIDDLELSEHQKAILDNSIYEQIEEMQLFNILNAHKK